MKQVEEFACGQFAAAKVDRDTVRFLNQILRIRPEVLWKLETRSHHSERYWKHDLSDQPFAARGQSSDYDGLVKGDDTGIAGSVDLSSGQTRSL